MFEGHDQAKFSWGHAPNFLSAGSAAELPWKCSYAQNQSALKEQIKSVENWIDAYSTRHK